MQIVLETEQIHNAIARKLQTANNSITVCVAWFTSKSLASVIKDRLKTVKANILISDHEFNNKASHFNMLLKYPNCNLYILPTGEQRLMHNKFCVIDSTWVITGSYNWSDKAETNYENILLLENKDIAAQYQLYFERLREKANRITDFKAYVSGNRQITSETVCTYEQQSNSLAKEFETALIANLETSKRFIKVDFNRILDNIQLYSAVGAARIYCNDKTIQSGLKQLKDAGHLELSFEWMVLQPKYSTLFSDTTKNTARQKLIDCRYSFPDYMTA
jgi:hypothetical protein